MHTHSSKQPDSGRDPEKPESKKPTDPIYFAGTLKSDTPTPEIGGYLDSPDEEDLLAGREIGNYKVIARLGRGGFGDVYKARDAKLERFAALKFLRLKLDSDHRKLFQREAQVIANLAKHPLVVQIYEWGEYEGSYYFALEYLEGSADRLLRLNPNGVPVAQALEIAADCAEALAYAHERGVLHRDVKPANILIDEETNRAKLADFGLARFHNLGIGSQSSVIAGSPPYMSPEQAEGTSIDPRSDVYALGVTLYELLSGQRPYSGKSSHEILENVRRGRFAPLSQYRPDLPRDVHAVVHKAMARKASQRFQTAKELEAALRAMLRSLSERGSTTSTSSRVFRPEKSAWGVMAIAGVVMAITIGVLLTPPNNSSGTPERNAAILPALAALDSGNYSDAISELSAYLQDNPGDDTAAYASGFAHYLNGRVDEARAAFAEIEDAEMKADGEAILVYADQTDSTRAELERIAEQTGSAYANVLLASIDLLDDQNDSAIQRLESVAQADLQLEWQRAQRDQLLGRAYFAGGRYEEAAAILGSVTLAKTKPVAEVASVYEKLARAELEEGRQAAIRAQIERLKTQMDERPAEDPNTWSSRPIRVWAKHGTNTSRLAADVGIDVALPGLIASGLDVNKDETRIEVADRENIGDILLEQELEKLTSGPDGLQLGRLVNARVLLTCNTSRLFNEDSVAITLTDLETSIVQGQVEAPLKRGTLPSELRSELADAIAIQIDLAYPLQGILVVEGDQPRIDIGDQVGVEEGMEFDVFGSERSRQPIPGRTVRVTGPPDVDSASVVVEGLTDDEIQSNTWYLRERRSANDSEEE